MDVRSQQSRVNAAGEHLVEVHTWLRQELKALREEADQLLNARASSPDQTMPMPGLNRPAPGLAQQLWLHCLSYCDVLHAHHTGEDNGMFPGLEREFPELKPTLDQLRHDHVVVARILEDLQQLLRTLETADVAAVRAELDRLASELERHLDYEERQLVGVLNSLS